jgi:hypothetical protein
VSQQVRSTGTATPAGRVLFWALLRAFAVTVVLVVLYLTLPLGGRSDAHLVTEILCAMVLLGAVITWELRSVLRAELPVVRGIQALATSTSLLLLIFASAYYAISTQEPSAFNERLDRVDALYFTVTVFATVGFGDIVADAQHARVVVTIQMLVDLVILGVGIRLLVGAVRRRRQSQLTT